MSSGLEGLEVGRFEQLLWFKLWLLRAGFTCSARKAMRTPIVLANAAAIENATNITEELHSTIFRPKRSAVGPQNSAATPTLRGSGGSEGW